MREIMKGQRATAHLLRRTCFGPTAEQWAAVKALPYEEALAAVLGQVRAPVPDDPEGLNLYDAGSMQQLWLERMVSTPTPFAERLALFWHGHFATSNAKMEDPPLLWAQYRLFRSAGGGPFRQLLRGVARDPAMILWLDGNANRKGSANENFARELQELFTLGIGNYSEDDVRDVARAFTGWNTRGHTFQFSKRLHDDGPKTVHGKTGPFDGDDVIDILLEQPAASEHLAKALLSALARPDAPDADVAWLAGVIREASFDIAEVLAQLLRAPAFLDVACERALVRSPVELFVATWRALGLRAVPKWVQGSLNRMGQMLFRPPSVKGWTSGTGWLTSGGVIERLQLALLASTLAPMDATVGLRQFAFGPEVPSSLAKAIKSVAGPARTRTLLASPEWQLA